MELPLSGLGGTDDWIRRYDRLKGPGDSGDLRLVELELERETVSNTSLALIRFQSQ
jgi:hypothetical protein